MQKILLCKPAKKFQHAESLVILSLSKDA